MKTLILLLLLSSNVFAGMRDYVHPNWCLPSYPYGMYVGAIDGKKAVVGQSVKTGATIGFVELANHKPYKGERLNILVQYVKTQKVKGGDGFTRDVDYWRQCSKIVNEPKLR